MMVVNPFRKTTCPYCFVEFYLGDCAIVSSQSGQVLKHGSHGRFRMMGRARVEPLSGPQYTQELAARRCPGCHGLLPHNMEYTGNQIIGLVGGVASGKSHYISVLINALERQVALARFGCISFAPLGADTELVYDEEYFRPLFENHSPLRGTQRLNPGEINRPLIYSMVFDRTGGRGTRRLNLMLFDASGEQIQDEAELVIYNRYILKAAGLIFLVDPLTLPGIGEYLPDWLRDQPTPQYESFRVLHTVADAIRREQGLKPGEQIETPVAITVAKSDLLRYVAEEIGAVPEFLRDATHEGGYNPASALSVSQEIEEFLARLAGPAFAQATAQFSNMSYHAVSATGGPPDETGRYPILAPMRVLDPLLWILWKIGVVHATRRGGMIWGRAS
jgi:hypothetical protein